MALPNLPYRTRVTTRDVVDFRGLDRTDGAPTGALSDALNLSTVRYPVLSPRCSRTELEEYANAVDAFAWDDRVMYVMPSEGGGAKLCASDQETAVCDVTLGRKQWAVVSGRLCVYPDKLVIDDIGAASLRVRYPEADADLSAAGVGAITMTASRLTATPTGDPDDPTPVFADIFAANDAVTLTGTPEGLSDIEHVVVRDVDAGTNSLVFDDNVLRVVAAYVKTSAALPEEGETDVRLRYSGHDYVFAPGETLPSGVILYIAAAVTGAGTQSANVYLFSGGAVRETYTATVDPTANADPPEAVDLTAYSLNDGSVHVKRTVPALDFICESGNRLWGLDVEHNTIVVSALGDPFNFYVFDGVDTDSYQLAVGSAGEWTGICAYGGGVCCWKENRLHKILGSYPSEYYMAEYQIGGVGRGCDRSLTVINDVLYYTGASGVYAYTGGTPRRIGDGISPSPMYPPSDTVGETDGRNWYLSGVNWRGQSELMVYDTATGLWIKEDDTLAAAMFYHNYRVHVLDSEGNAWRVEPQTWDMDTPWMAEFVPFDETRAGGGMPVLRKYYTRLDLRLDMSAGSAIKAEVQEDGGAWRTVMETDTTASVSKRVAILPRRCDRFAVRLSGKGYVVLRAMTREFVTGSERV